MSLTLEPQPSTTRSGSAFAADLSSVVAQPVGESFASYLAHELRTPLATQRALLEVALADASTDTTAWREMAEDVLLACGKQERLLESCLALARSRGGLRRHESVDLATIAADVLRAEGSSGLVRVAALTRARTTGDPGLIERLVVNLVSNATRHNVAGGRIEVETRSKVGRAVLSVANTGPVVPAGELQKLFEPFYRLNANARSLGDGVGLGLAIVRAVADAHDALLAARARPGGGLAIDVAFPALD